MLTLNYPNITILYFFKGTSSSKPMLLTMNMITPLAFFRGWEKRLCGASIVYVSFKESSKIFLYISGPFNSLCACSFDGLYFLNLFLQRNSRDRKNFSTYLVKGARNHELALLAAHGGFWLPVLIGAPKGFWREIFYMNLPKSLMR